MEDFMLIDSRHSRRFMFRAGAVLALGLAAAAMPVLALAPGFVPYTKEGFEAALKGTKPVLVHVHAEWCPVCKRQETVFKTLADKPDFAKITPVRVNFDTDKAFNAEHKITYQSAILLFKGGKEISRLNGETDQVKIAAFIADGVK
jgi:thioredoxin 1